MDMSATFKTNQDSEISGVWHSLGDGKIKIARANNPKYDRFLRREMAPHATVINSGSEEGTEILTEITMRGMAEAILVDFENITDEGKELQYTKENAYLLLKKYPDFRDLVAQKASTMKFYREEYLEQSGKK